MCGRFILSLQLDEIREALGVQTPPDWLPRYNIAPSQPALTVRAADMQALWMRWGLVPGWAKDPAIGARMINARAETLAEKPAFRQALARRRCLVPASGFYEWQKLPGGRGTQPMCFTLKDGKPFFFAGLWENWRQPDGADYLSFTLITCAPNSLVAPIHDRMPVMLKPEQGLAWLQAPEPALLAPFPADEMQMHPVSKRVNSPEAEGAECAAVLRGQAAGAEEQPRLF